MTKIVKSLKFHGNSNCDRMINMEKYGLIWTKQEFKQQWKVNLQKILKCHTPAH